MHIQVPVICAVITNDEGQIFLQKRIDPYQKEANGKWEFPGGKVDFNEGPLEAVVRETKEETGFDIKVIRLLPAIYHNRWQWVSEDGKTTEDRQVFLFCYECKITAGEYKAGDQWVADGQFFDKDKIDYAQTLPYTKEIIAMLDQ
ncbi:NUDIX domain-containing protein [Patescibacteria group bacterium]|nr:NUDIX domain-containing protein [Patescibacteria group bacterium]